MHAKIIIKRINATGKRDATSAHPQTLHLRPFQVKQWMSFLNEAKDFREKNGHCLISHKSKANPELARWARRQRYQYKQYIKGVRRPGQKPCQMTPERIEALNAIGFCWDTHEETWEERFNELKEFGRVYGHLSVPSGPRGNDTLATWIKGQRRQYKLMKQGKSYSITTDRIDRLTAIGFRWELKAQKTN